MTCAAICGGARAYIELREKFHALLEVPPSNASQFAFNFLWEIVVSSFVAANSQLPLDDSEQAATTAVRVDNREHGGYMAGWSTHKEMERARRLKLAARLRLLVRLLQPEGEPLPEDDPATWHIFAREIYGGLTRVRPEVTSVFVAAQNELVSRLSPGHIQQHKSKVYTRASAAARRDAGVRGALRAVLLDDSNDAGSGGGKRMRGGGVRASPELCERVRAQASLFELDDEVREAEAAGREMEVDAQFEDDLALEEAMRQSDEALQAEAEARAAEQAAQAAESAAAKAVMGGQTDDEEVSSDEEEDEEAASTAQEEREAAAQAAKDRAASDAELAEVIIDELLQRLFNSSAKEFRNRVLAIVESAKSESSVALRMRLKVKQTEEAKKDAREVVLVPNVDLRRPPRLLFEVLSLVVSEAPKELERLSRAQLHELIRASCKTDGDVPSACKAKSAVVAVLTDGLASTLVACAEANPDGGFWRSEQLQLPDFHLRKDQRV